MAEAWQSRFAASFGARSPGLVGGNAANFSVTLEALDLIGGSSIQIPPSGATVIVGANNVGKSTLLRELINMISRNPGAPEAPRLVLKEVQLTKRGDANDAIAWIGDHTTYVDGPPPAFQASRGSSLDPRTIDSGWQQQGCALGGVAQVVVHYSHAQDRFSFGGAVENRASLSDPATHPLHELQDTGSLLSQLSTATESVFGQRLTLDALGRVTQLRVGTIGVPSPPVDDISAEYREAMAALPTLDTQGDGMRGFLGQLLPLMTSSFRIIALDEPEAFLHPPQAYGLGQQLGRLAVERSTQVLLATHDRNLLAGLLDSGVDVSVVRLQRNGKSTDARQLDAASVTKLWRDPVLKYTNVLDGLFHRAVVLAEAEADCAYYSAALDVAPPTNAATRDLLFVPTGGKDGMARVATSLASVGVPIVATVDLDLLNDITKVELLVRAIGGAWDEQMNKLWQNATADIRGRQERATVDDVRIAIDAVLQDHTGGESFTPELQEKVAAQIRTKGSRWAPVKEYGLLGFKGSAHTSALSLVAALDAVGVVLVKEGELERLAPDLPVSKGAAWLPAALAEDCHRNVATQAHIARIRAAASLA